MTIAASFDIGRFRNAPTALAEGHDAESAATGEDIVPDENDVAPATTDPAPQPQTERTEAADSTIPSTDDPASADDAADGTVSSTGDPASTNDAADGDIL